MFGDEMSTREDLLSYYGSTQSSRQWEIALSDVDLPKLLHQVADILEHV